MNWIDWLFIVIIILSIWQGMRSGFIAAVAKLVGLVCGFIVAITGYRPLSVYIDQQWGWRDSIANFLLEQIPLPVLQGLYSNTNFNELQKLITAHDAESKTAFFPENMVLDGLHNIANHLAITLLYIISFIALLLVISLLVTIILRMFSGAVSHTFLKPVDRFGGLVLGLVRGGIIVLIIIVLLEPLLASGVIANGEKAGVLGQAVKNSFLIPYAWQVLNDLNLHFSIWPTNS